MPKLPAKVAKLAAAPTTATRSASIGSKRALDKEHVFSSDEEEQVDRPLRSKAMIMSIKDFQEKMTLLNHPIMDPENKEQLELTYRYIELANSMLRNSASRKKEMADMEADLEDDTTRRPRAAKKDGPPFFRGNMATTILVSGVDQIQRAARAKTWSQALLDLMWEARVTVQDFWVVKRQGESVVSVLVQMSSRYQKILAMGAINNAREKVDSMLGRAQCRVFARDAFPQAQLDDVQAAFRRGYELKKAGRIQAYRIYNQGGDQPVFEVRTLVDGRPTWGPAPPTTGDTPKAADRESRRRERGATSSAERMDETGGEMGAGASLAASQSSTA
jgi:hypothetical protein